MEHQVFTGTDITEPKPLLDIPQSALEIQEQIVRRLRLLTGFNGTSCLESGFVQPYTEILSLFDKYQNEVLAGNGYARTCRKGCSYCCCHWVEDVNSFEAEMIASHIRKTMPGRIDTILRTCEKDIAQMQVLDRIASVKEQFADPDEKETIDHTDLLLAAFYQMKKPCPLLNDDGACGIYEVRPVTCRIYMSFSDPLRCRPDYINDGDIPTYLLDLEEEANELFDWLHFRFMRYEGDTGLRSLLVKYLSQ